MKLGRDTGEACLTSAIPSRTTPGMGVHYEIDDDFEEARYTNPFPTADDELDEDPQEVCRVVGSDSEAQVSSSPL